jgi:hypothetical protein
LLLAEHAGAEAPAYLRSKSNNKSKTTAKTRATTRATATAKLEQRQKQIPCGDDRKKSKGSGKT